MARCGGLGRGRGRRLVGAERAGADRGRGPGGRGGSGHEDLGALRLLGGQAAESGEHGRSGGAKA